MKPLCIYHGGCPDGFGAAYAIWKYFEGKADFFPTNYGANPPDVTDRDVIIADFSYKRPVLEEMAQKAKSILVLDHHKTAKDDLAGFPRPITHQGWENHLADVRGAANDGTDPALPRVLFDMNRSGAMITWEFFHGAGTAPHLIHYIQDRDLWRKRLARSDDVAWGLRSYPQDFEIWDQIIWCVGSSGQHLADEGATIKRFLDLRIEELKKNAVTKCIGGYTVPVVNAPHFLASDLAGELAEGQPFAACWFVRGDGKVQWSLRSREGGVDVQEIAKQYGGGGHPGAAGFELPFAE